MGIAALLVQRAAHFLQHHQCHGRDGGNQGVVPRAVQKAALPDPADGCTNGNRSSPASKNGGFIAPTIRTSASPACGTAGTVAIRSSKRARSYHRSCRIDQACARPDAGHRRPQGLPFWLDPAIDYVPALKDLLKPTSDALEAIPVANPRQPRDDDATLIKPAPQVVEPPTLSDRCSAYCATMCASRMTLPHLAISFFWNAATLRRSRHGFRALRKQRVARLGTAQQRDHVAVDPGNDCARRARRRIQSEPHVRLEPGKALLDRSRYLRRRREPLRSAMRALSTCRPSPDAGGRGGGNPACTSPVNSALSEKPVPL